MKLQCKQHKFIEFLEKLSLDGIFSTSTITVETKDKKTFLFSVQKASGAMTIRYLKVEAEYFDVLEAGKKSINIEIPRFLKIMKNVPSERDVIMELEGNKVSLDLGKATPRLPYTEPEESIKKLPISVEDGVTLFGKKKTPLDVSFVMELVELKDIVSYAKAIDTEFFEFVSTDKNISVRIGDIHDIDAYVPYACEAKLKTGKTLDSIYTYGIKEMSNTFTQNEFTFHCATDKPAWIYEKGDDYILAIAIPPKIKQKD